MTKEELKSYQALKREKEQLEELLEEIELAKTSPKSPKMDAAPRGGSRQSGLEDVVAKYEKIEEMYHAKIREIDEKLLAIEQAIDSLSPNERRMMRYRYIQGLKWEEVCVAMPYSWNQAHTIHRQILNKLRNQ